MNKNDEQMIELIYNILLEVKPLIEDALFHSDVTEYNTEHIEPKLENALSDIKEAIKLLEEK